MYLNSGTRARCFSTLCVCVTRLQCSQVEGWDGSVGPCGFETIDHCTAAIIALSLVFVMKLNRRRAMSQIGERYIHHLFWVRTGALGISHEGMMGGGVIQQGEITSASHLGVPRLAVTDHSLPGHS